MWTHFYHFIFYIGLPVVAFYHQVHDNAFLNIAAKEATGLEKLANTTLIPVHYLLDAKQATLAKDSSFHYEFSPRFDYSEKVTLKLCASVLALPFSATVGPFLKGCSFFTEQTRIRHQNILQDLSSTQVVSQVSFYQSIGIDVQNFDDLLTIECQGYKRRPGAENHLHTEKEALEEICEIFKENQILYWIDCGTLLGALRYGGVIPWDQDVDLAILENDHDNVLRALNLLDQTKYAVQDWSGRAIPKTYIRVYVKEHQKHIDIYHFRINAEDKTVYSILSNEHSRYMPKWWRIREGRFIVPSSFEIIFPLKKAYFDGVEVLVPNQTKKYLQQRYGENIEPAKIYSEVTQDYEKDLDHPYWQKEFVK